MPSVGLPTWPHGASAAVCLTFDVDADVSSRRARDGPPGRSTVSHGRFGITRGLPRILDLLVEQAIPATFYVPGWVAEQYATELSAVRDASHEIGHHGYLHLRPDRCSPAMQRKEIERGTAALVRLAGTAPRGYRSPAWELTDETLALLLENGFSYDSSCMGDDRPYFETLGDARLLELPVHWSLDDWPYYSFSGDSGGSLADVELWRRAWLAEVEQAVRERRLVTLTLHPEVIGRGYRFAGFERLVHDIRDRGDVWFARHGDVADLIMEAEPA